MKSKSFICKLRGKHKEGNPYVTLWERDIVFCSICGQKRVKIYGGKDEIWNSRE
jgi:hypothetical protein